MNMRKAHGRYEYEVEPGRWVSRQAVWARGQSCKGERPRLPRLTPAERLAAWRTRRAELIAAGKCLCGGALATKTLCAACRDRLRDRVQRLRAIGGEGWRKAAKEEGSCGSP